MPRPHFTIYMDEAGSWRWSLKAGNGERVAQSEAYSTKTDARRGAKDARRAARLALVGK